MWKEYLTFSKKQRTGFWLLMILILLAAVYVLKPHSGNQEFKIVGIPIAADTTGLYQPESAPALYPFDPNHSTESELRELGFNSNVIKNLKKYHESGGLIQKPDDLLKIYGMDSSFYRLVKPYIRIQNKEVDRLADNKIDQEPKYINFNHCSYESLIGLDVDKRVADSITKLQTIYWINLKVTDVEFLQHDYNSQMAMIHRSLVLKKPVTVKASVVVELNTADTAALKCLPGIGEVLSVRIIKYRKLIGGFYSINQLTDVYGWSAELTDRIRPFVEIDTTAIRPLSINKSSLVQLKEHPYIGFYKAREIVEYRKQKGGYITNLNEIYNLKSFSDDDAQRLHFYLCL